MRSGRGTDYKPTPADDRVTVSAPRARQGSQGRQVLYILIGALILGAIYVLGSTFFASRQSTVPPGTTAPVTDQRAPDAPPGSGPPATGPAAAPQPAPAQ
jgi:hypothetical protein